MTITLPVVAEGGTGTMILVAVQVVGVPGTPLKVMVLAPWVEPKLYPVRVIGVVTVAIAGERVEMLGGPRTVNPTALLVYPLTVTTTFPLVALLGTGVTIEVGVQVLG